MKAYLPNDVWYEGIPNVKRVNKTGYVVIPDNKYTPPVHMRGGSIIPIADDREHVNTDTVRNGNFTLMVLPGRGHTGQGELFWDDGDSIDTIENNNYNHLVFNLGKDCELDINVIQNKYPSNKFIQDVHIYGTNGDKVEATLDGKPIPTYYVDNIENPLKIAININLNSKKVGDKWTLKWKSIKTNSCNFV